MTRTQHAVTFTSKEQAALTSQEINLMPLAPDEVRGRTLYTLISPGTELAHGYTGNTFPYSPGYAAAFEVEEVGHEVKQVAAGDRLFCMGNHRSLQQAKVTHTVPIPDGLPPEKAVLARLMSVTMTTLVTTTARPPDKVLVMGLGPVGFLAAHIFQSCGYDVYVCDLNDARRSLALASGLPHVYTTPPLDDPSVARHIALALECSGHEQAALDACRMVQKRGEVVQVARPWTRKTERFAQELLVLIFDHYVVLRSGWEWELPLQPMDFRAQNIWANLAAAMQWLWDGRIKADGWYSMADPRDAQSVYQELLHYRRASLFTVFDWRSYTP